jgi:hypothetical protein
MKDEDWFALLRRHTTRLILRVENLSFVQLPVKS